MQQLELALEFQLQLLRKIDIDSNSAFQITNIVMIKLFMNMQNEGALMYDIHCHYS